MLLSPEALLQGFHFPQPCYTSFSSRALHMYTFQKVALLHYRCLFRCHTNFPAPLTFQDCTVKGSQLKVSCKLNALSVSVSRGVLRPCLHRWAGIYWQLLIPDQQQMWVLVRADRGESWRRVVTLHKHCRKQQWGKYEETKFTTAFYC